MTTETNPREEKGKAIPQDQITRINSNHYTVKSQTVNKTYNVVSTSSGWSCGCPDHRYRHVCCKHIHAVEFSIKIREEIKLKNTVTISPVSISECLYCKSDNITKDGLRHNKYGDTKCKQVLRKTHYWSADMGKYLLH